MLICRHGAWQVESDGYVSSEELRGLDGLREVEAARKRDHDDARARLAARVRALKRRAWRRGYDAGREAALRRFLAGPVAAAFVARRLDERLADLVLDALERLVGDLPADVLLPVRLRRCMEAARAGQILSLRVPAGEQEETRRVVGALETQLQIAAFAVIADAGLEPDSLVVETEHGVIDGSLMPQLRALERGIREAVAALLDTYRDIDGQSMQQFEAVRRGLQDVLAALGPREEVAR